MEKHMDRRVVKTKRAICNALIELLGYKNLNEITITDIATIADVNRKTIYNYYMGIHEILEEIEDNLLSNLDYILKDYDIRHAIDDPNCIYGPLTKVIDENLDFYGRLLSLNMNSKFVFKLVSYLEERIQTLFIEQNVFAHGDVDLVTHFVVTTLISSYQYWFLSGRVIPLTKFSKSVHTLVCNGFKSFVK